MKRYDFSPYKEVYVEELNGEVCKYSDVEKLIELNEEMLEVLEKLEGVLWKILCKPDSIPIHYCISVTNLVEKAEKFNE